MKEPLVITLAPGARDATEQLHILYAAGWHVKRVLHRCDNSSTVLLERHIYKKPSPPPLPSLPVKKGT